jgi:hypothetical protein
MILPTGGMPAAGRCIDPRVHNLWGLTRRLDVDLGRATAAR